MPEPKGEKQELGLASQCLGLVKMKGVWFAAWRVFRETCTRA